MHILEWRPLHVSGQTACSIIHASPVANNTKRETARTPHTIPLSSVDVLAQDNQQDVDIEYPVECLNQWLCYHAKYHAKFAVGCCFIVVVAFFYLLFSCSWIGSLGRGWGMSLDSMWGWGGAAYLCKIYFRLDSEFELAFYNLQA